MREAVPWIKEDEHQGPDHGGRAGVNEGVVHYRDMRRTTEGGEKPPGPPYTLTLHCAISRKSTITVYLALSLVYSYRILLHCCIRYVLALVLTQFNCQRESIIIV